MGDSISKAISGKGTVFSIGTSGGTPVYTPVAELKTFQFSGTKNDTVDVTNSDSAGRAHEFIVTLLDSGSIAIAGNYIGTDAGQIAFRAAFNAGTVLPYKIVLPMTALQSTNGDTFNFLALVEENDLDLSYDKEISFSIKCKVSGLITFTAGT